jgi:hypothetical protein
MKLSSESTDTDVSADVSAVAFCIFFLSAPLARSLPTATTPQSWLSSTVGSLLLFCPFSYCLYCTRSNSNLLTCYCCLFALPLINDRNDLYLTAATCDAFNMHPYRGHNVRFDAGNNNNNSSSKFTSSRKTF